MVIVVVIAIMNAVTCLLAVARPRAFPAGRNVPIAIASGLMAFVLFTFVLRVLSRVLSLKRKGWRVKLIEWAWVDVFFVARVRSRRVPRLGDCVGLPGFDPQQSDLANLRRLYERNKE